MIYVPVKPGQTLLHYCIADKIGEGGMGEVWKAIDTTLDREVAIRPLSAAGQILSNDEDSFSLGVSFALVPESFCCFTQRVGSVDDRRHPPGFEKFLQDNHVLFG